jgi:hypothetical protein
LIPLILYSCGFRDSSKSFQLYSQRIDEPNGKAFYSWVHLSVGNVRFEAFWLRLVRIGVVLFMPVILQAFFVAVLFSLQALSANI